MIGSAALPDGLQHVRSTPEFAAADLPAALLAAHQLAPSVWGVLRVLQGKVVFVTEAGGTQRTVSAGEEQVIEPEVRHHVEPADDAVLVIDFYR